ncbi:MAG: carboxymuconolactone decarboxylase family protein [Fusobacterium sp.]|nr:carboxymuconolactone decarboxylase family protein [Fusobacterium sp.]
MAQDILTNKQQNIAMISSYTATGDLSNLEKALNKGLDNDLTVNEIKEILVQMYAYCGFPKSLNALNTFMKIVETRKDIKNGNEGTVLSKDTDKFAYGDNVQFELTENHIKGGVFEFAPAIDQYLKEHLFADIFARGVLTYQEREIATVAALSSLQGLEPQLKSHIQIAKNTGLTDLQVEEILRLTSSANKGGEFGLGQENTAYAKYFIGKSYLNPLTTEGVSTANVTFEPRCRNNWHIHHKGGQILLVTSGRGYYQEWGKEAQELKAGDVVNIPAGVKHWHGAAKDSWFSHVAIAVPAENASTEWLEEVSDDEYNKLK